VIRDEKNTVVPGFYAAGECACVSVHGANRLGTNSLVDILVFGRRAGKDMAKYIAQADFAPLPPKPEENASALMARLREGSGKETKDSVAAVRDELQREMMDKAGVFRTQEMLAAGRERVRQLQERYQHVRIQDQGRIFNTDLVEAIELGFLLDVAQVTVEAALTRQESRGAHSREDFPKRDDANWLKHSLGYRTPSGAIEFRYKPVIITRFQPQERKY
jgi:succinate dehydrogenase / fumarate reductase flavoprotein subunit